ncbi:hypothetical protein ACIO14_30825 [Nocardia fluminea]|uniref:hypothetical protein n=1 Tax=Nocardia fluminea TaxID=134984 RepID=UPI0037FE6755
MRVREFVYAAGLFTVVAVPGCGHSIEGTAVAADGAANNSRSTEGTWIGSYHCAQGATGLTLTVQSSGRAEFEFYPLPENPTVPTGRFAMQWQTEPGHLVFRQSSWIDRPGSYRMVDLIADRTDNPAILSGTVTGEGCSTFWLSRDRT